MSNPFDELFDGDSYQASLDQWIESKQAVYEEKIVKKVLTYFKLEANIPMLKREAKEWSGEDDHLTFSWFHYRWPSFPVRLCTQQTVYSHQISVTDLYKRFTTTKMYKAFAEADEYIPDMEQYAAWGLVFPWAGMGNAILHNSHFIPCGTRFMKDIAGKRVYLDIFNDFLEAVAASWVP